MLVFTKFINRYTSTSTYLFRHFKFEFHRVKLLL